MNENTMRVATVAGVSAMGLAAWPLGAQDVYEDLVGPAMGTLETTTVVGSKEEVFTLPGSAYFLEAEESRSQNYTNVNRMLARVPGVYVREEDGFGNFPNISIRGADGTRSEKTTIMEDGILSAPATYSAPGAYYSPRGARMSAIEILKGSSQVRYGPHTTGGVINYLSTPVPVEQTFFGRLTYGSDNTYLSHLYYGDSVELGAGRLGFLLELFANGSDGFRTIAPGTGYGGSDETGFEVVEPMVKLMWESTSGIPQRVEFKYGYTDLDADETYTGLTERDADRRPNRRYAATRFDNIETEHHRTYLKYLIEPTETLSLEVAAYYNYFERAWYKLHDLRNVGGMAGNHMSIAGGLLDPAGLALLQGAGPGDLRIRDNAREYELYGAQFSGAWTTHDAGPIKNTLSFGGRLHYDESRRKQRDDIATQDATGAVTGITTGAAGSGGNRKEEARASSFWIEDVFAYGDFTIRPGIRYEYVDGEYTDFASDPTDTPVARGDGSLDAWAPGIAVTWNPTDLDQLFAGVYKGISMPGPRSFIRNGVDAEESVGYELGYRTKRGGVEAELIGFYTDFSNLIGSDTGLGGSDATNAGEAEVYGLEALVSYDPLAGTGSELSLPVYFSATWTPEASLDNALSSGGGDNIYTGGKSGARIPYLPDWKLAAGTGFSTGKWGGNLDATYVTEMYGTAANFSQPVNSAQEGETDALFIVDLSAHYVLNESARLVAGISNLFDERGIVSRIPHGPRDNQGRAFWAGAEISF